MLQRPFSPHDVSTTYKPWVNWVHTASKQRVLNVLNYERYHYKLEVLTHQLPCSWLYTHSNSECVYICAWPGSVYYMERSLANTSGLNFEFICVHRPHNYMEGPSAAPTNHSIHKISCGLKENSIFQLRESETCLISTMNKCRIMFALVYFDMGTCFYMFEQKYENFYIQN